MLETNQLTAISAATNILVQISLSAVGEPLGARILKEVKQCQELVRELIQAFEEMLKFRLNKQAKDFEKDIDFTLKLVEILVIISTVLFLLYLIFVMYVR